MQEFDPAIGILKEELSNLSEFIERLQNDDVWGGMDKYELQSRITRIMSVLLHIKEQARVINSQEYELMALREQLAVHFKTHTGDTP